MAYTYSKLRKKGFRDEYFFSIFRWHVTVQAHENNNLYFKDNYCFIKSISLLVSYIFIYLLEIPASESWPQHGHWGQLFNIAFFTS